MNPRMTNAGEPMVIMENKNMRQDEDSSLTELLMDDEEMTTTNKN
jgi:hypothetical protein